MTGGKRPLFSSGTDLITMQDTKHIPKKLAQTGRLDMNRTEITQINGHLFKLRMHVNLVSNVLGKKTTSTAKPQYVNRLFILILQLFQIRLRSFGQSLRFSLYTKQYEVISYGVDLK